MRLTRSIPAALVVCLGAGGCGGDDGAEAAGGDGRRGGNGPPSGLPPVPVAVERIARGPIASAYAASASLEANNEAAVLARVSGVVLLLWCEEGDLVAKDQPLLRIEDEAYRLRLAEAEAQVARQENRHERATRMLEGNFIAQEEFEVALNDLAAARAQRDLAELELSHTTVRAPFGGRIVRRDVDVGRNVQVGTPLFALADFGRLLARVHVPARELRNISAGQSVELILDSTRDRLSGRISLVSPVIDRTSGTVKVTVEIDDFPSHTRPGDFAEVRIETERHADAILVSKTAVIDDEGDRVVYVAPSDSTIQRRVVDIGFQNESHAEVVNGLAAGERVVVQGQRSLRPTSTIRILDRVDFTRPRPDSLIARRDSTGADADHQGAGGPHRRHGRRAGAP